MNDDFEIELLAYLRYRGEDMLPASAEFIRESIRNPVNKTIFNIIAACHKRFDAIPSLSVVRRAIEMQALGDTSLAILLSDIWEKMEKIYSLEWESIVSVEYILIPEIKRRLLENTAVSLVSDKKEDGETFLREQIDILDRINLQSSTGESFIETIEIPTTEEFMGGKLIRSPWATLNQWLKFGSFCPGNLILFAGNRLKSMVMGHITANAFQYQDVNCVYLTMELSVPEVKDRFKACILQKNIEEVAVLSETEIDAVRRTPGENRDIWVEFIPADTATVSDLRAILKKRERKAGKIDLIVVDYADLLTSREKHERYDLKLQRISAGLKGLAGEMNSVLITASQLDTETAKGQDSGRLKMVSSSSLADAKSKRHAADMVITICQTKQEEDINRMRLATAKSRSGAEKKMVYLSVNHKKMSFREVAEWNIDRPDEPRGTVMHR